MPQIARDLLLVLLALISLGLSLPLIVFSVRWIRSLRIAEPGISTGAILLWAGQLETSLEQIRKFYEWRVEQWQELGKAILAALLAFVFGLILSTLKAEIQVDSSSAVKLIFAGALPSLAIYIYCLYRVSRLRREFMSLYNLLLLVQ